MKIWKPVVVAVSLAVSLSAFADGGLVGSIGGKEDDGRGLIGSGTRSEEEGGGGTIGSGTRADSSGWLGSGGGVLVTDAFGDQYVVVSDGRSLYIYPFE